MKGNLKTGLLLALGYVVIKWMILAIAGYYLYSSGLWSNWYLLIFPIIGLTLMLIRNSKKTKHNQS